MAEEEKKTEEAPQDFAAFMAAQPDEVKAMYDTDVKGLKSALGSERDAKADLEKQLRDAAAKAEKGSESQKELEGMADKMAAADQRSDFLEAAHAAGVKNLKLAYTVAREDEMFNKRGGVNFETMEKEYPELFGGTPAPAAGNAGAGTTTQPASGGKNAVANAAIRRASGRY